MALTLPNIPPIDYIPVVKDLSTGETTYIVNERSAPETIEETLGISQYIPDGNWWDENYPLLSIIQRNKVSTIPSILVGESVSTAADIIQALSEYSDGNVNFSGVLTALTGRNLIGYIAAALGFSIAKDSFDTVPEFWDAVSKAVFGDIRDKDIKAPTLIKDGKTYVPKKMISAVRKALYDSGLSSTKILFPEVPTVAGTYDITAIYNPWTFTEDILKQKGWNISSIKYNKSSDEAIFAYLRNSRDVIFEIILDSNIGDSTASDHTDISFHCNLFVRRTLPVTADYVYNKQVNQGILTLDTTFATSKPWLNGTVQYYYRDSGSHVAGEAYVRDFNYRTSPPAVGDTYYVFVGDPFKSTITSSTVRASNINLELRSPIPTFDGTGDISEVTTDIADAYPKWADAAIDFPARVGAEEKEKEKWYPLTIPDAIPWTDGYTGTQEKAQEGELTKDRTETKNEVLDNTLPDVITKPDTKTDVKPNPTPTPLPTIPSTIPSVDIGLAQLYNPTTSQLKEFSRWLWGIDFDIDQFKKLFADPMQAIIGLHAIYVTPTESGSGAIQVGYINSGVTSQVVKQQFTTVNCGTVHIPESFGDARDYSPFTTVDIYLPFIGIQQLNTDDVMGADVTVTYKVDVMTGACIALISVKSSDVNGILYSFTGNCAIQLPITSGGYMQTILSLLGAVTSTVAGGAVGGAVSAVAGAVGGIANVDKTTVHVSGSLSGNAGAMGVKKPFITIRRPQSADAARYNEFYGYPTNKYVALSSVSGFTRIKDINLSVSGATEEEQNEIIALLKEGVIL